MRIAVLNWSRRRIGGVESYLNTVIPDLLDLGYEIAFWYEFDQAGERKQIFLPDGVPTWCVSELGAESALSALCDWQPDLLYTHVISNPDLEAQTLKIAPAIYFAHGYFGTCISGAKTFKKPTATPCDRIFGWPCLLHYYPHRCGGLSPITMIKEYRRQSKRLELLHNYRAILTDSDHLRAEYTKHGLAAERVYYPVTANAPLTSTPKLSYWRLLFIGRMDYLKGGCTFIDALPQVGESLGQPLHVTFAGDGPDRETWERQAARVQVETRGLNIEFVGWVDNAQRDLLLYNCDLLVIPSLWPEPFGLVGPEAGLCGVPAAAFAVGGIPEWLKNGVNGFLAPGDPPTAAGLAEAIIKCLHNPSTYQRLKRGALEAAQQFSKEHHLRALLKVFEKIERSKAVEVKH